MGQQAEISFPPFLLSWGSPAAGPACANPVEPAPLFLSLADMWDPSVSDPTAISFLPLLSVRTAATADPAHLHPAEPTLIAAPPGHHPDARRVPPEPPLLFSLLFPLPSSRIQSDHNPILSLRETSFKRRIYLQLRFKSAPLAPI